jgi:uncharacterized protein YprB with RNaseH-like and TPR domain
MSFEERMHDAAAQKAVRRAELERLLAENAGRLMRASEIKAPVRHEEPACALSELLANSERIQRGDAKVLVCRNVVPVAAGNFCHPRGYEFAPSPTRPLVNSTAMGAVLEFLTGDDLLRDLSLESIAFIDLETTGLAGASGTYPILIGLGYFSKNETAPAGETDTPDPAAYDFICEQYFLEDYCHEEALLLHLRDRLEDFCAFCTFNGKTFDLPMLTGRYIMNRVRIDLERPHLDLLHVVRRIFRSRIGQCNLGNIEKQVLRLEREHDINGSFIPQIYFDYLRGLWPERLIPVFDHNAQDIISMGSLLLLLIECLCDPAHPSITDAQDLCSLGRLSAKRGDFLRATDYFERASLHSRDSDVTSQALSELARIYKKEKNFSEAASIWRDEFRRSGIRNADACIELLKLLEHELHCFEEAIQTISAAEQQLRTSRVTMQTEQLASELQVRRTRIERKLARLRPNH